MAIWITVLLIVIGIFLAISLYLYDNSQFSKITGYNYFSYCTDKKIRSAYKLIKALHKTNGEHSILVNVKIPFNGSHKMIDAILVHESGIYVIDVKQYDGWIYGREQDLEWAQALHKGQLNKFYNPIVLNKRKILMLNELLPEMNKEIFHSLIAFSDSCSFKKVEIYSENVDVIKTNELAHYLSKDLEKKLSKEQIKTIYQTLEKYMDFSTKTKSTSLDGITVNE